MTKTADDVKKFIKIAEDMLNQGEIDTSINRLYIAAENIASLMLEKRSIIIPKRHDKIANAIEHLFKTGKINKDFSVIMRRLYDLHLFSDYGRKIENPASKEELKHMLAETKSLLKIL
ncbi:MAG: HEPN domain-containing protein [Candidatus Aenigmatarchaeota archaeon]